MKTFSVKYKTISIILGIILFYMVFMILSDFEKIKLAYEKINWIFIPSIIAVITLSLFLRSMLQKFLLNSIGISLPIKENFELFLAGLSMLITPGGTGQIIKSYFIQHKYNYPVSKSIPLVFTERFLDLLSIITLLYISMMIYFSSVTMFIIIPLSVAITAIFIIIKVPKSFRFLKTRINKIRLFRKIIPQDNNFDESVKNILSRDTILKGWLFDVAIFLVEGCAVYLGFISFNVKFDYFKSFQIYYSSVLYGTVSFIPGGVGILEGVFWKMLTQENVQVFMITSIIIFIRLTTTWFATSVGLIIARRMAINQIKT